MTPLALDGLEDEGRDVVRRQGLLQRCQVAQLDLFGAGKEGAEALAEGRIAVDGERAVGEAVKGLLEVNHPSPTGRGARELDRGPQRSRRPSCRSRPCPGRREPRDFSSAASLPARIGVSKATQSGWPPRTTVSIASLIVGWFASEV